MRFGRRNFDGKPPNRSSGHSRGNRRTKQLVPALQAGEIAMVYHQDIDRVAAEGLVSSGIVGVVNANSSMTGRYPNLGALIIVTAGIPLLDEVGVETLAAIKDGAEVSIDGDSLYVNGELHGRGVRLDRETLETRYEQAKETVNDQLAGFAANTLEYIASEPHLITERPDFPELDTDMFQRQALVVVRGIDYREDLEALRRIGYISDLKPILVGVDGGADALIENGYTPDIILGDFDSVSKSALSLGAELIVHGYPGGDAPGAQRLDRLDVDYKTIEAHGTSEDLALSLAFETGVELIVLVGSHTSMVDFLDKGREGMASTFLTRMKVAPILVDAKGVSRLYRTTVRKRDLTLLVLSALFTIVVIALVTEPIRLVLRTLWLNAT